MFLFPTQFQSFNDLSLSGGCGSIQHDGLFRDAENSAHSCYTVHMKNRRYWARIYRADLAQRCTIICNCGVAEMKHGRDSPEDEL